MFPRQTRGKAVEMSPAKVAAALAICARCSVTKACANGAIERREMYGIWGGLTPERINRIADDRARMVRASTQQGNRT
jgi:WhiB family redox-sensing transcriptional regulator